MPPVVAVPDADLYVGAARHVDGHEPAVVLGELEPALAAIAAEPGRVCVLAGGPWDPLSVVVLIDANASSTRTLAWGRPEAAFAHRAGMVTKAEVRAVALGKLDLPMTGVVWDVGAGSGSVAIECAALAPG